MNIVLRILPDNVLKSALKGLLDGLVDIAALRTTMIWALCPDEYYEEEADGNTDFYNGDED